MIVDLENLHGLSVAGQLVTLGRDRSGPVQRNERTAVQTAPHRHEVGFLLNIVARRTLRARRHCDDRGHTARNHQRGEVSHTPILRRFVVFQRSLAEIVASVR